MKATGSSQLFWLAVIAVIAVPVSVDQFLGFMAKQKGFQVASTEPDSQLHWQQQEFKELGVSMELPSIPQPDKGFVMDEGEDTSRVGAYVGAVPQLRYQFGRFIIDAANPFDAKAYLKEEMDGFKKAAGISDVKGSIEKIDWENAPAYESNITFSRCGKPSRLHFRVRATAHDWFFLGGEYPLKTEGAGEHAWKTVLDSLTLDPKQKADAQRSIGRVAGSEPIGFDRWRFTSPDAGIALTVPCKLEEPRKSKIGSPGDESSYSFRGHWTDTTFEVSAVRLHSPITPDQMAKADFAYVKKSRLPNLVAHQRSISFDGHPACATQACYSEDGRRCESAAIFVVVGDLLYVLRESYYQADRKDAIRHWEEILDSVKLDPAAGAPSVARG